MILHEILAQTEDVTELQPVPDAHVPVMKFKFHGISIDLLYASASLLVVPDVSYFQHVLFIFLFPLNYNVRHFNSNNSISIMRLSVG
jgi:hypothetical protein